MEDCIFCKIGNGDVQGVEKMYEDEEVLAFGDIHPKAPVHVLVIPKTHIQSIAHLEQNHNDVIAKLIYTAKRVAEQMHLRGYKLIFNVGKEGGQVIDHLHLHLLGGWNQKEDAPNLFSI